MIQLEPRNIFHCKCERCEYEWDSFHRDKSGKLVSIKPRRCARCKYRTWNGEDQRFSDPFSPNGSPWARSPVPTGSRISVGTSPPKLQYNSILEAFNEVQGILAEVVEDNPCNHDKGACTCREQEVLAKVTRQIDALIKATGKKAKNGTAKNGAAKNGTAKAV